MPVLTEKDLPPNARGLWLKALSAVELKNYGYAISLLQSVIKETPQFLQGRQVLRRAEIGNTKGKKGFLSGLSMGSLGTIKAQSLIKKDPLAAMFEAEKMLESDPASLAANRLLRDAAMAADMPETASFALETIHEANPKDVKILHELAKHYYDVNDGQKSLDAFNKILAINPNDIAAVKGSKDASAMVSMASGGWETAKDYRDLIKDKDQAVLLEQKNRVVRSEEMIQNHLADLSALYEQDPTNLDVVRKIGTLYEQGDDLDNALIYFKWAADLTKHTDEALVRKANDVELRIIELKLREDERWLAENGEQHEESARRRAELDELHKHKAEMQIGDARKRVERNPTDLQLRFELGEHLFHAGHYQEAMPELQKARQNPNLRVRAISYLGQCMVQRGMFDLAVNQFREAAAEMHQMDAVKKDLLYNLGITYEHMGRKEDYIDCMKKIYEVDFGYRDVSERVEKSYAQLQAD